MRYRFAAAALALLAAATTAGQAKAEQPTDYCRRVGNDDTPRDLPSDMARQVTALFELAGPEEAAGATVYRCASGKAFVCYVGANLPCAKIETQRQNEAASRYCRENPDDTVPAAVSGHESLFEWRCVGRNAEAGKPLWRLDSRGFAAELWKPLP